MNEHVLAGQYFSPHVIVADHESVVLKISPKNLRKMEIDSPNTFKQMLRTVLYTESLIRHSLEAEEEHAQFNTTQHKTQIEKMRKLQDAENFKKLWETPFTVRSVLDHFHHSKMRARTQMPIVSLAHGISLQVLE